jgi:hypothetical protein
MKEKKQRKFTRPNTARKHKKVLDNLTENGGNMRRAILDAGYSQEVADNPQKITESKTFLEVLEDSLPDEKLSKAHEELLEQKRIEYFVFPKKMDDEEIKGHVESAGLRLIVTRESDKGKMAFYSIPDAQAKSKALEMAYKLKGKFSDENKPPQSTTTYNLIFSGPVQEKVRVIDAEIKEMLAKTDDQEN